MEYNLQKKKPQQKPNHYAVCLKLVQYCKSTIILASKKILVVVWEGLIKVMHTKGLAQSLAFSKHSRSGRYSDY